VDEFLSKIESLFFFPKWAELDTWEGAENANIYSREYELPAMKLACFL
jgi:hypothetical protein